SEISKETAPPPVTSDWTIRFYKWDGAGKEIPPADWEAVLKSPILDEVRMSRLHLIESRDPPAPPTPRVPPYYFALVAKTEVTLGDGESVLTATADDGVRVWLDDDLVINDWTCHPARTNKVAVVNNKGRRHVKVEFFQGSGVYALDVAITISDPVREKRAKREVNAAVALLRMGQSEKVWPLLKHTPDPRVRSYLIHALSPLGADASAVVKQLNRESDVAIRRALLLSLGEFGEKDVTSEDRKA